MKFNFDKFWKKINIILSEIQKHDLVSRLCLTTGNCGCFAIALSRLFEIGDLFVFGHGAHVVLKVKNKYIDGTGIYSRKEITEEWGSWGKGKVNNDEEEIIDATGNYHDPEEMLEILIRLINRENVRDYYV